MGASAGWNVCLNGRSREECSGRRARYLGRGVTLPSLQALADCRATVRVVIASAVVKRGGKGRSRRADGSG